MICSSHSIPHFPNNFYLGTYYGFQSTINQSHPVDAPVFTVIKKAP